MMAFSSTITLRRQLDRSDVSAEIALIHLAVLRQTGFSVGFKISVDSITISLMDKEVGGLRRKNSKLL